MLFSSSVFVFLFLPLVLFIYYAILHTIALRNIFLLLVSLLFYAWGEPYCVLIMLLSITANYFFALWIDKSKQTPFLAGVCLTSMVFFNLGIFFIFKYLPFTISSINSILETSLYVPKIALPIGISFFTFQAMSYVFDVYRGKGQLQKNPLYVGLYISFFPQLVAGPIVRYQSIADQITNRKNSFDNFASGVCRFTIGLSKKLILANSLALVANQAFNAPVKEISVLLAWLGMVAYTFQIFYDFSGYSDMAIGLGKMFGFHFEENFNYPYVSKSISDFWRRWHISLGTWFRDYVYIPLGGSKGISTTRIILNLFIVWTLTGIWHGANWTFFCWGLFYFILLCIEKFIFQKFLILQKIPNWIKHIVTLLCIMLGWVLFRSESITHARRYLIALFGFRNNSLYQPFDVFLLKEYFFYLLLACIFAIPIAPRINNWLLKYNKTNIVAQILAIIVYIVLLFLCTTFLAIGSYNPFIYFNF